MEDAFVRTIPRRRPANPHSSRQTEPCAPAEPRSGLVALVGSQRKNSFPLSLLP